MPGPVTGLGRYEQIITLPEPVKGSDMKVDRNGHEIVITILKAKTPDRLPQASEARLKPRISFFSSLQQQGMPQFTNARRFFHNSLLHRSFEINW